MAYATNELTVMNGGLLESNQNLWLYRNTAGDSEITVKGAGYISDGSNKGMKVGDVVFVFNVGGTASSTAILNASAVTAGGAATVAAGVVIT